MSHLPDHTPLSSPFTGSGPRIGVVVSHGFTGSPHGVRDWALALAAEGYAVRMPLLPGHGTSWQDLARTRWTDWHKALDEAYLDVAAECDHVIVAGLSMGGALALRLAATRPVAGAVLVNPGLVIDDPRAPLAGLLKFVIASTPSIADDILKPGVDEGAYARTPVAASYELHKMFKDTLRLLPGITAPVRVFRSDVDHVVSESSVAALRWGLRNAPLEVIRLKNSYHVATLDHDAPDIFRGTAAFVESVVATGNPPAPTGGAAQTGGTAPGRGKDRA